MTAQQLKVRLGTLSVGFTQSIQQALSSLGISPKALFEQFELDKPQLNQAHGRLSIARYMRLGHAATTLAQRADFGLLMGRFSAPEHFGLAGVCAAQAPNLRAAARCLTEFEPLYAQNYRGQSQLIEDAQGAWLRFYSISPYNDYNRFVVESVLSSWLQHLTLIAQQPVHAEQIAIEYPAPSYSACYVEHFAAPVHFAQATNQLRLSQHSLSLSNPKHCPHTWQELLLLCRQRLQQLTKQTSLTEQVISLIAAHLKQGEPTLEEIAALLNLPSWTLRRRLAAEHTQFNQLLQQTRYALASSYIADTPLSFSEIAWLLGFTSPEAFQRAFKRWSKFTPGEYRRHKLSTNAAQSYQAADNVAAQTD
ncbi:AraC family transcriptional regulator [Thiopseudomonas alkaliphila]|uniref:AraC family transcriptional regulator n=1 Tax=Thiopseudomonas alkaliphila TaxID=1697053 RepID=UPI00069E9490|nr:AraC family transcriptional regulator [Thiopseudomonas alkaliphila]AKX54925.1 AraC family transcriptional regulator [Thiopseudomonas alkaliphila]MDM1716179.1 AraC family transcriptional regulator [Thiopseudomonas alkaliphila]